MQSSFKGAAEEVIKETSPFFIKKNGKILKVTETNIIKKVF